MLSKIHKYIFQIYTKALKVPKKYIISTFFAFYVMKQFHGILKYVKSSQELQKIANRRRTERDQMIDDTIPDIHEIPTDIQVLLLESDATNMRKLLNKGIVTSEQILNFFYYRTCTIGLYLELIAEVDYRNALMKAKECDEIIKRTPLEERDNLGLLFGIPISVKDVFVQKGMDSSNGLACKLYKPYKEDGDILKLLTAQGAIPFVRSNVPQLLALNETVNLIYGRSKNPWDINRVVGGSSGGAAGLVAAYCAPLSLASDGLGSIRIPAAYNGVFGIKPTSGRNIVRGHSKLNFTSRAKFSFLRTNCGPITRSVDDLTLFLKSLFKYENRNVDPTVAPVPWNDNFKLNEKLNIGYVVTEEFFGSSKAHRRAVLEVAEALRNKGHNLIDITIPNFEKSIIAILALSSSDGKNRGLMEALKGENLVKEMRLQFFLGGLPNWLRGLLSNILGLLGQSRSSLIVGNMGNKEAHEIYRVIDEMGDLIRKFYDFWNKNKLDAIILPSTAVPAVKHSTSGPMMLSCCYCFVANLYNLPAGTMPITVVKKEEEVYDSSCCKNNNDDFFKATVESMKNSEGLPVGIQVWTLPFEDEKCVAVMKLIDNEIQFMKKYRPSMSFKVEN